MGFTSSNRHNRKPRGSIVAALDIGTSKICCFIARVMDEGGLNVIGIGHHVAKGVKSGTIVDMDEAVDAVRHAVHAAERMAREHLNGQPISEVVVNVPGVHAQSSRLSVDIDIDGHEITDFDVRRALAQARNVEVAGENELIHALPAGFSIDGHRGIMEPRGMYGQTLSVQLHAVTAATGAVRNLSTCLQRAHLEIEGLCVSPYAAALACLVEDEMDLGCTLIDMGAGTTSVAVFIEGQMVFCDAVPVGGAHVTSDIARGLTTPLADAERIKTLYGSAYAATIDESDLIDVPLIGEEAHTHPNHVPRSILVNIIQPRLEETFEMIRAKLDDSGFGQIAGRRVVLTGGASQLSGLRELGQLILDKQIRLGRPTRIMGLAEATGGPGFSAAAGLLIFAAEHLEEQPAEELVTADAPGTLFERVSHWLRENW